MERSKKARKQPYTLDGVLRSLSKKREISISVGKHITIRKDATEVGNGSWGKIDYLTKVHGYSYIVATD